MEGHLREHIDHDGKLKPFDAGDDEDECAIMDTDCQKRSECSETKVSLFERFLLAGSPWLL